MTFTREQIDAAARELYGARATYDPAQVERALAAAAATPTPPADDVREAVAYAVYGGKTGRLRYVVADEEAAEGLRLDGYEVRPLFEVRPRGPVDGAGCEMVYGEPVSRSARQTIKALQKLAQMGVVTITGKGGAIEVLQEDRS